MPTKAAYLALADDTELEFEHYLAVKLGKTVRQLRHEMDQGEFVRWSMYYARIAQQQEMRSKLEKG